MDIEKLEDAARIARTIKGTIKSLVKPGMKIVDVCEAVEKKIIELGALPAFPCNVSINEVAAHYSSPPMDPSTIPENSLVKVDFGVHVDGWIVDTAITLCFDSKYDDFVESAELALKRAIEAVKPGVLPGEVGRIIEKTIKSYGLKPIRNLCGHKIERYQLHAGKNIPNVPSSEGDLIREGEVYAIEPFSTNGAGFVVGGAVGFIYKFLGKGLKKLKRRENPLALRIAQVVEEKYSRLPFSSRWIYEDLKEYVDSLSGFNRALVLLERKGVLYRYPVLIEARGGMVAQAESTIVVEHDGARVLV